MKKAINKLESLSLLNEEDKDWMTQEVRHILQLVEEDEEKKSRQT